MKYVQEHLGIDETKKWITFTDGWGIEHPMVYMWDHLGLHVIKQWVSLIEGFGLMNFQGYTCISIYVCVVSSWARCDKTVGHPYSWVWGTEHLMKYV